jgi:hypothetical protein
MFKSKIHFVVAFVDSANGYSFFQNHVLKSLFLLHEIALPLLLKSVVHICVDLFLDSILFH